MSYSALYSLLPSLFDLFDHIPSNKIWNSIMKYCWKECLDCFRKDSQPLVFKRIFIKEYLEEDEKDETTTKYAFGILDGYIWKTKFEEKKYFNKLNEKYPKLKSTSNELNNEYESWETYLGSDESNDANVKIIDDFDIKMYDLNIHLLSPDMDTIHGLFKNAIESTNNFKENIEEENDLIKWKAEIDDEKIK